MSGRSGYRKTDRKRRPNASSSIKPDFVLRFVLPRYLAFAVAPGGHGWGVHVGYNDVVFVHGNSPRHCAQLCAEFMTDIGAFKYAPRDGSELRSFSGHVVKLLPCRAYRVPERQKFAPISADLEAIHDNISRHMHNAKPCSIHIGVASFLFVGVLTRDLVIDARDEQS